MKKFLYWVPRVLGILAILFISLFALDAFQEGMPISQMLLGFTIHLIPSIILAIFLIVAWKWELIGGIVFVIVSTTPFFFLSNPFWMNGMLGGPFLLTGVLFILNSRYKSSKQIQTPIPSQTTNQQNQY
jgi:hypothetical protein